MHVCWLYRILDCALLYLFVHVYMSACVWVMLFYSLLLFFLFLFLVHCKESVSALDQCYQ